MSVEAKLQSKTSISNHLMAIGLSLNAVLNKHGIKTGEITSTKQDPNGNLTRFLLSEIDCLDRELTRLKSLSSPNL